MKTEKDYSKSTRSTSPALTERKTLQLIAEKIKKSKKVLVVGHRSPDLDCVGSLYSLFFVLKSIKKETRVLSGFDYSAWDFFKSREISKKLDKDFKPDLIILVDYAKPENLEFGLSQYLKEKKSFVITIDHHPYQGQLGDIVYIDPDTHSCSEILADLYFAMKVDLRKETRIAVLTGMFHDTGIFAYYPFLPGSMKIVERLNVTGEEFRRASLLCRSWSRVGDYISFMKYSSRLTFDEKSGLGTVIIGRLKNDTGKLTSNISNQLIFVHDIKVALVLKRLAGEKKYKASIRSAEESGVDVSRVAAFFGGGGHKKASGFQSNMSSGKIIAKVKQLIREQILQK